MKADLEGEEKPVERKITVECGSCGGDGQKGSWEPVKNDDDAFDIWEVYTCGQCEGKGSVEITVHDYRTKDTVSDDMIEPRSS